jgi:transmembrane sensor
VSGPFDGVQTIELADGSTLRLNADSLVKVRQSAARREVILVRGQVAFDVMTDPRRPFDVISDHVRVSVTGTQFTLNRRSFDDVEALVSDGTVVLIREAARAERVELQSGDVMRVKAGRLKPQARLHADDPRLAWLKEQLSYVNPEPLRQVVEEFNRYNELRLRIVDPSIEEVPVCGLFDRRDPETFAKGLRGQQIEHQVSVSPTTHRREILLRGVAH